MPARRLLATIRAVLLAAALLVAPEGLPVRVAVAAPLPDEPAAVERYRMELGPACDSLYAHLAAPPVAREAAGTREELADLCDRLRAERAAAGGTAERVLLELIPARGPAEAGLARITLQGAEGPTRPARLQASVKGAPFDSIQADRLLLAATGGRATPVSVEAGLRALVAESVRRGYAGAEARLDSMAVGGSGTRLYATVASGPVVRVESVELVGATETRGSAAASIGGLRPGAVVTPEALEAARERLKGSGLFASVGAPRAIPGSAPDRARIRIPVEEVRSSRFEGAVGIQQDAGLTGLLDLALGNIGGSGRSAGARWRGFGGGRSEYAASYREPALFGRPVDASLSLSGSLAESLYTETRWSLTLSSLLAPRARGSLGLARSGAVYTGLARGVSSTWTVETAATWDALSPVLNPDHGASASLTLDAGRRRESTPGLPDLSRGLLRASLRLAGAVPLGRSRALYGSLRADGVTVGGGDGFPAEELRYLGGSEDLRGHMDRAFAGDRILAASLEHRWLTGGVSRTYLFLDAGYHELDGPLAAGGAPIAIGDGLTPSLPSSLARTQLSRGWDFGYGAGLRTRLASGSVGVELGFAPGASVREAKIHLHYSSRW